MKLVPIEPRPPDLPHPDWEVLALSRREAWHKLFAAARDLILAGTPSEKRRAEAELARWHDRLLELKVTYDHGIPQGYREGRKQSERR